MIPTTKAYGLFAVIGLISALFYGILPTPVRLLPSIAVLTIGNLGIMGLLFWDYQQTKQGKVRVHRALLNRLSIGQFNPVHLTIETGTLLSRNQIELRDFYPDGFEVEMDTLVWDLPPKTQQQVTYKVKPLHRGVFQWGDIQVRQRSPWGLVCHDWRISAPQTVSVYPDLLALGSLTIKLALQSAGALRQRRRLGMGTEFAELRDYHEGDDPRLIDWKATARRDRPLLRVLEPEQEQTMIILLDRGRLMTAQVDGLSRFDHGLNATLALATAGLHRGDRVGIGVFDRGMHRWIPPARGQHRLAQIIEQLTPLQPVLQEPDYMLAVTKIVQQQTRRALVVMLTDLVDATASTELLTALTRLTPRYLPFCVTLRDPEVDRLARVSFHTSSRDRPLQLIKKAYTRAVALDLLAQRELVFATLRRQGVLVLDAPAHQVSESLVERYLHLKMQHLL